MAAQSHDGAMSVAFNGTQTAAMPAGSVFTGADSASAFFHCASIAHSPSSSSLGGDGSQPGAHADADHTAHASADHTAHTTLRMVTPPWRGIPVQAAYVQSSFFEDRSRFPPGTVEFDSAIAMHEVPARWEPMDPGLDPGLDPDLCSGPAHSALVSPRISTSMVRLRTKASTSGGR
ncbi:hypothetical protein GCM10009839_34220 [Catenulispora yoronensis]|uniref:Uncharacterized protein n=1 Tax=Catenulispora yoronensis TaxID=450799 RepID=A0ABN2U7G9_9ACTN